MQQKLVKIDLGCGNRKYDGFIGLDRTPLPDVDIVADLNEVLPIDSDSVDLVYASHSLEHVRDITFTMSEIYRICKHGAQVCIVVPYDTQMLNTANPYHITSFNEHTPRFWTDYPNVPIDSAEYAHPHAANWGLARSDNSIPEIDIRLIRLEFFYFKEYRALPVCEQREMRRDRLDVCDQIMYHLVVWKKTGNTSATEFDNYIKSFIPFEPKFVLERKQREQKELLEHRTNELEGLQEENEILRKLASEKDNEIEEASKSLSRLTGLERSYERIMSSFLEARTDNQLLREQLIGLLDKIELTSNKLQESEAVAKELESKNRLLDNSYSAELEAANGLLNWYRAKEVLWNSEIASLKNNLNKARPNSVVSEKSKIIVSALHAQLTQYRRARSIRLLWLFRSNRGLWNSISPAFSELKNYVIKNHPRFLKAHFNISEDLRMVRGRDYTIPSFPSNVSIISLGISPLLPATQGRVEIKVVSATQNIIGEASVPLTSIDPDLPTVFKMEKPMANLDSVCSLRVFVVDADVPVAIYEFEKLSILRRKAKYMPFFSLTTSTI